MAGSVLGGVSAGLGGLGSIYSAYGQQKELGRSRQAQNDYLAKQQAIRNRVTGQLEPVLNQYIQNGETEAESQSRESYQARQDAANQREVSARRQQIVDQIARSGNATGRMDADITAPAANARLSEYDKEALRQKAEIIAARNAENERTKAENRRAAINQRLALGQFETGTPYIPYQQDESFADLGEASSELLGRGLDQLFARYGVKTA